MAELILALDLDDGAAGLALLERLPETAWVKIGSILFTGGGPDLVRAVKRRGHRVFLDLKWHDIPHTVRGAVKQARGLGVDMVTVHTLGGQGMMAAAKDAAGDRLAVVGVTVLTSHDPDSFGAVVGRSVVVEEEVVRLVAAAKGAGIDGVVSSPAEVSVAAAAFGPGGLLVTPGIRSASDPRDDQARVATVAEAVQAGSTHLVVGRPVLR
ncbi:MAG: orotidine-5'-phosphate decarboxylase, partial [Gemmatimonadales bacterium]